MFDIDSIQLDMLLSVFGDIPFSLSFNSKTLSKPANISLNSIVEAKKFCHLTWVCLLCVLWLYYFCAWWTRRETDQKRRERGQFLNTENLVFIHKFSMLFCHLIFDRQFEKQKKIRNSNNNDNNHFYWCLLF